MKKALGFIAASLCVAAPAMADSTQPNTDFNPAGDVSPGVYGKMSYPVTSKFKLSIGGYVKLDYAYNTENFGATGIISPSSGAMPSAKLGGNVTDQSVFGVNQSRIWFKADGPSLLGAKTTGYLEGDFYGGSAAATESPLFRIRHAYGAADWTNTQVLFGQYWDMFAPMIANTQDFRCGSPYGAPNSPRIPQIRLTQRYNLDSDQQVRLVVGIQDPAQTGDNNTATGGYGPNANYALQTFYSNKTLGTAPGYFGQAMNPLTVGLFGLYGSEKSPGNNGKALDTYGYGAYAFVPVIGSKSGINGRAMTMSLEGQTYIAANQAFNGATEANVLGKPAGTIGSNGPLGTATTETQTPAKNWAATAQIIFYPTQNLGLTGGWGRRSALSQDDYKANGAVYQRYTQEAYANVAYDLNAAVRVAAEYQNFHTVYGNAATATKRAEGTDNTYRLAAYYFF